MGLYVRVDCVGRIDVVSALHVVSDLEAQRLVSCLVDVLEHFFFFLN